jgi:ABC-2 type transport system permease protein
VNARVFLRSLRDVRRAALIVSVATGAFFYLILLSSSAFVVDLADTPFVQNPPRAIEAFLGGSADFMTPAGWLASGLMHPVVLSLQTAGALMIAAGAVATEVERGSLELVLTRPVRRGSFLAAKLAASLVVVTGVQIGGLVGVLAARLTVERVDALPLSDVVVAFLGAETIFAAFACVGLLISAGASLRGRALGAGIAVVVASFFLNFLALLFDDAAGLRFASPFHYYRPADLVEGEGLPDLLVLVALAAVAATLAAWRFARRDLTR